MNINDNMKTLKNIFAFLMLLPVMASCHFLEVEKTGKTSIKNFYSDVYALDAAVNGIYGLTYKFYDNYMVLYPEVAGDLIRFQTATSEWRQQFDFVSDENEETTAVGYIWKNGYEIIANANEVIQYGPSVSDRFPQQAATVRNYIAQAYFLRALVHLDLCLVYGQTYTYSSDASHLGTAVMTTIPDVKSKIARSSASVTYKQILSDLQTALDMFADGWTKGCFYASPAACGSWWRGVKDSDGIPYALQSCGAPRGYFVADIHRNGTYDLSYKCIGRPASDQLSVWAVPSDSSGSSYRLYINVFGGSSVGIVRISGLGRRNCACERSLMAAPEVEQVIRLNASRSRDYRKAHRDEFIPLRRKPSPHLWQTVDLIPGPLPAYVNVICRDAHMRIRQRVQMSYVQE